MLTGKNVKSKPPKCYFTDKGKIVYIIMCTKYRIIFIYKVTFLYYFLRTIKLLEIVRLRDILNNKPYKIILFLISFFFFLSERSQTLTFYHLS